MYRRDILHKLTGVGRKKKTLRHVNVAILVGIIYMRVVENLL